MMPMMPSKISAMTASLPVTVKRSLRSFETGMPYWFAPSSPVRTPSNSFLPSRSCGQMPMYLPYWTGSGSSRLYFSRKSAMYAGEHARSPHLPAVGSPGMEKTMK